MTEELALLLILLSDIAATGVRIMVCLLLISGLLSCAGAAKKGMPAIPGLKKKQVSCGTAVFGGAVIAITMAAAGMPDFYRMALEAGWIAVCACRFRGADARMSLFIGIFYEIGVFLWQFLFAAWASVLSGTPEFLAHGTGSGQTALWLFHGGLIILAFCLARKKDRTGKEEIRIASAIVLAGFIGVVTLSEQSVLPIAEDVLDMWTILAVVLMMSVLVFNMNRQYEVEKELAGLKAEQAELLERDYTALNNAYAVNARLFHDFHNHIGVLRQLLSHEKVEEAVQYLDGLQAPVQEMADTVWTGDETVDYLINSKAAAAAESGIYWQAQVEFPRRTNLKSADLCAILGNLLDNAIEGAVQIPEPDRRRIDLTIRRINQMLVIKVENTFLAAPVKEGDLLKTTKTEKGLHGWGLKSARTAAEKYDGMVQTTYSGGVFRAVATLSYQGVTTK